jgi:hypothetical protein
MVALLPDVLTLDDSVMQFASRRFTEAFGMAWRRIPADAQLVICDYFHRCPGRVYVCYRMDFGEHAEEPWGRCSWYLDRTTLTFLAPFVEGANPIEALVAVIAHELAHCYHRGLGTWVEDSDAEERNTRRTTEAWAFDDPSPGDRAAWNRDIENWRRYRTIEFGEYTERRWLNA